MKKINIAFKRNLLIMLLLCAGTSLFAQLTTIINIGTDESLVTKMTQDQWANTTKLIITTSGTGKIIATDFANWINKMPKLGELDMAGDMNSTTFGPLNDNKTIRTVTLPPKTYNISSCSNSVLEGVIEFPRTVKDYGEIENKFLNCQNITGFAFPDGHPTLSTDASGKILFSSFSSSGTPGKRLCLYLSCNTAMSYTIPEDVAAIGLSTFGYNHYLTELTFSSGLVDIFRQNGNVRVDVIAPQTTGLRAIHVPESNPVFASTENGFLIDKTTEALILIPPANKDENIFVDGTFVKRIGSSLFSNFPHIKSVVFGEGFEEVGYTAFKQGSNGVMQLEFVSLPSTTKIINGEAFALCENIKQYICKATTPPVIAGNAVFRLANGTNAKVGVPAEAVSAYLASDWLDSNYKSYDSSKEGGRGNAGNGWSFQASQIIAYKNITYVKATGALNVGVPGAKMKITADEAPEGDAFNGWISDPEGVVFDDVNAETTYFTMPNQDVTIEATYAKGNPYTIIDAITPSGFAAVGATVTIKAAATKGATGNEIFQGWEIIEGEGVVIANPKATTTTFKMIDGPVIIKAVYKTSYTISIKGGSAIVAGKTVLDAFAGETIGITSARRPNQEFSGWTSSTPGVAFDDASSASTAFTMPESDVEIAAGFVETTETGSGFGTPGNIYPSDCFKGDVTDFQLSWIANDGGIPRTHVPHSMDALFVRGDGTVATICGWDEGGTNVGVWKDSQIVSIPVESGTGSWGRNSGKAVVMDDQYVYQLMRFNGNSGNETLNSNGLRNYPPKGTGIEWQLITRYFANSGQNAPFSTGYGPLRNMLFVCPQESRFLKGLAITDDWLIAAVPGIPELQISDSIKIYDKNTMAPATVSGFPISEGGVGFLYADKKGFVWMLQGNKIVAISLKNGAIHPQSTINLPANVDAKSFSIDIDDCGNDRLLVANSGIDMNILIYTNIYTNPVLSKTFGVTGGNLVKSPKAGGGEYLQGESGPLRFPGPTGVGVDDAGNIYISNMFVTTPTAALYSYNEAAQTENWKQEGLVFTSTADFDQTQKNRVYNMDKIFDLDYTKAGGRIDKLVATSVNPFAYPQDMRLEPNPPSPIKTSAWKRKINGTDYLFVSNMYSTILAGYRFDKENHGYIAIPCVELRADGIYFWEDTNGDGQKTNDEITRYPASSNTFSTYPDKDGNIWMADNANQVVTGPAFRIWKVKGVTSSGVLQYAAPVTYKLPSYITLANRVLYDAERDEMLVGCYTTANKTPNTSIWGQVGTTILTFKNMTARMANIATTPSSEWVADQELLIPASASTSLPDVAVSAKAMTYAGDYIFTFLTADGKINVYERSEGNPYVGQVGPTDLVQKRSGWTDFTYALNARKNDDGTYELLAEENAFAKILHYNVKSFSGDLTLTGDLVPERIWVQNGAKEKIDPVNIPEGQPVVFTVRVRNIESGPVTNLRRTDPGRCLVYFKVMNKTGQVVYEALSKVHEENIYGGDYIDMSVLNDANTPFWIYTKGEYTVEVDVNYGRKGKECLESNNYMPLPFGNGDNTGVITGPLEPNAIFTPEIDRPTITIYPNPASTYVNISVGNTSADEFPVELISIDGRNVMRQYVKNHSSIQVSSLDPGYYILRATVENQTITQKVIVK